MTKKSLPKNKEIVLSEKRNKVTQKLVKAMQKSLKIAAQKNNW